MPKPVNLPSLRKVGGVKKDILALLACPDNTFQAQAEVEVGSQENAGNDVTTQIVPASSGGSWQQPQGEQQTPAVNRPNWAASGTEPAPALAPRPARDRRLNPHDYPSLSAAAAARHQLKQPVPSVPESQVRKSCCSSCLFHTTSTAPALAHGEVVFTGCCKLG